MADGSTPNHSFTLPEVGASKDSWGTKLNANWTTVDALLNTSGGGAGTFLPLAGGTMSGALNVGSATPVTITPSGRVTASEFVFANGGDFFADRDGDKTLNFRTAAGTQQMILRWTDSSGRALMQTVGSGSKAFQVGGVSDTILAFFYDDGFLSARVEAAGTSADAATTIMTREKGDARYTRSGQDADFLDVTANNSITITANGQNPLLSITRTDNATGLQRWATLVASTTGALSFIPTTDAGAGLPGSVQFTRDANGLTDVLLNAGTGWSNNAPADSSALTRLRGDNRYLRLTGGSISGSLNVTGGVSVSGNMQAYNILTFTRTDGPAYIDASGNNAANLLSIRDGSQNNVAVFAPVGASPTLAEHVMTRGLADARYVLEGGDTMSGDLNLQGANGLILQRTTASATRHIWFRDENGVQEALIFTDSANTGLEMRAYTPGGALSWNWKMNRDTSTPVDLKIGGTVIFKFHQSGAATVATHVLRKSAGDALYAAASSLDLKDDVRALELPSTFWDIEPISFTYGGALEEEDPRRGRMTSGFSLDDLKEKFPDAVKFDDFVDVVPIVAALFNEVKGLRGLPERVEALEASEA